MKTTLNLGKGSGRLLNLDRVLAGQSIQEHRYIGRQVVAISQIRGSANESRARDFDAHFRPLQDHTKSRWLAIAAAQRQGKRMPPVSLLQVGDIYFVQDGHHRISVARSLANEEIEAEVTVLRLSEPVETLTLLLA
jgi:hypothetical protein